MIQESETIELYCQSSDCPSPLIEPGSRVSVESGNAHHANMSCPYNRARKQMIETRETTRALIVTHDYETAVEMALEGRLKFTLLEQTAQREA